MFINSVQKLKIDVDGDTLKDLLYAVREYIGDVPYDEIYLDVDDDELILSYEQDL